MKNSSRRGFMGKVFAGIAGVGAVASLYAMKKSWDPCPIFVFKQSAEMLETAQKNPKRD